jgi:hypothetical protein
MRYRPHERMEAAGTKEQEPKPPRREAPPQGEPGRTPGSAEAGGTEERQPPQGEPDRTPGSAEGEDPDAGPSRH